MRRLDRRLRRVIVAAMTVVAVMAVALVVDSAGSDEEIVGHVDDHPITRDEVAFHMSLQLRAVQNRLQVEHGLTGPWDWEQPVDGVPARQVLQDAALEQLTRDKQVFLLAQELGLIESADHATLLEAMTEENAARGEAVARGEVVYGTVEFGQREFYATVLTELETQIARTLSAEPDGELYVSRAEIEARYLAEPENWTANVARYRTQRLRVPLPEDSAERAGLHEALRAELGIGTLADVAAAFPGSDLAEEIIDGSQQVSLRGPDRDVLTHLTDLETGQRTDAVEREGHLIVYELTGREVNSDEALEAYATRIREALLAEKFEDLLSARIGASDIDVDHATVRSIDMEELEQ